MDYGELPSPASVTSESYDDGRERNVHPYRMRRLLARIAVSTMLLDAFYMSVYKAPIDFEEMRLSGTEPTLTEVFPAPHNVTAETVVVGGFGVKDSRPIAEALSPLGEIGAVYSLEQDNRGIDPGIIAQKIIEQAKKSGITEITLWNDSVSNLFMAQVAEYIQRDKSPLHVIAIVADCSPVGADTLRQDKQRSLEMLQTASSIPLFHDIALHPAVGFWYAQQKLENRRIASGHGFGIGTIFDEMYGPDQPSSGLLATEALQVVNPSIAENFKNIAKVKDKTPPMVISIRPNSDTGDAVVNSTKAEAELDKITRAAGLLHIAIRLPDISHGDPTANREQYQKALKNIILPMIQEYRQSTAIPLYHKGNKR